MNICLTFSAGRHFTQMRRILEAFKGHDVSFVTIKAKSTENLPNVYYIKDTAGPNKIHIIVNMIIAAIQSLKVVLKERPFLIISTGTDVTILICYLGKLFSAKLIFIENISRVIDLSPTGKIVYPIADLFLVQWKKLSRDYVKGVH